jgi:hypothetical protein
MAIASRVSPRCRAARPGGPGGWELTQRRAIPGTKGDLVGPVEVFLPKNNTKRYWRSPIKPSAMGPATDKVAIVPGSPSLPPLQACGAVQASWCRPPVCHLLRVDVDFLRPSRWAEWLTSQPGQNLGIGVSIGGEPPHAPETDSVTRGMRVHVQEAVASPSRNDGELGDDGSQRRCRGSRISSIPILPPPHDMRFMNGATSHKPISMNLCERCPNKGLSSRPPITWKSARPRCRWEGPPPTAQVAIRRASSPAPSTPQSNPSTWH